MGRYITIRRVRPSDKKCHDGDCSDNDNDEWCMTDELTGQSYVRDGDSQNERDLPVHLQGRIISERVPYEHLFHSETQMLDELIEEAQFLKKQDADTLDAQWLEIISTIMNTKLLLPIWFSCS
jgi:hypothetical protein